MQLSSKVTASYKNVPLLTYLSGRFSYLSHDEWAARIAEGRLQCNGRIAQADTQVTQGDVVVYDLPEPDAPPIAPLDIVYDDPWLLAVNKPADLMVHASGPFVQQNLIYHLRQQQGNDQLFLVNRLDRDTTGVILVAKEKETLRQLSQQFADSQVEKVYLALVNGRPPQHNGRIDLPLVKLPKDDGPPRFAVRHDASAKDALTEYELVRPVGNGDSLLRLFPKTGRTHQLRVHMQAIGCPIVGDKVYGRADTAPRHLLHCASTTFIHPHSQQPVTVTAPLPADMTDFIGHA